MRRRVVLFFIALFIYNLNLRPIPAGDTAPAALLPFAILADHTLTFDRFALWYTDSQHMNPAWFRRLNDGHYYSFYPIALPLLLTPLYAPITFLDIRQMPVGRVVLLARVIEKIIASLIAALSVVAFLVLAERLTDKRMALVLAVVYAFGSGTWSISSQALWQHGASESAIILGLICLMWAARHPDLLLPVALAGLCAGFSVALRLSNVIFFVLLSAYFVLTRGSIRRKVAFTLFAIILPAATLAYNLFLFGDLLGGYHGARMFHGNLLVGLAGLLISPSRGLLVFSPVFIFAAIGVYLWIREGQLLHPEIYWICLLLAAAHLVAMGRLSVWPGGFSFGPRLLTDVVPCLVILLIPAMRLLERSHAWKFAFSCALCLSIIVQGIGAFCYPNGHWDGVPQPFYQHHERLWDWRDNQIVRSAAAGPVLEPYRLAYRFLMRPGVPAEDRLKEEGVKLW